MILTNRVIDNDFYFCIKVTQQASFTLWIQFSALCQFPSPLNICVRVWIEQRLLVNDYPIFEYNRIADCIFMGVILE